MAKKRVADATLEEIVNDVCTFEDLDSALMIVPDGTGAIRVMAYDGTGEVRAATVREAVITFFVGWLREAAFYDSGAHMEDVFDWQELDWRDELRLGEV